MNQRQKSGRQKEFPDDGGKVVVVAVKASLEILRSPLVWALTHVAQPGDCVKLLVVTSSQSSGKTLWGFSGKKLWDFPGRKLLNFPGVKLLDFSGKKLLDFSGKKLLALSNFTGECTSVSRSGTISDQMDDIIDLCSQMMLQLHDVYDPNKIKVKIKIVPSSGAVAAEAKRSRSNWVILDNRLKHELKCCMEELQCNIIVMRGSQPKVLRLNLVVSSNMESEVDGPLAFEVGAAAKYPKSDPDLVNTVQDSQVTSISSPDQGTPLTATEVGTSSISSSDQGASPYFLSEIHEDLRKEYVFITEKNSRFDESNSDTNSENPSPSIRKHDCKSVRDVISFSRSAPSSSPPLCDTNNGSHLNRKHDRKCVRDVISLPRSAPSSSPPVCDTNSENLSSLNQSHDRKSVRDVISLSRSAPSNSPPLCSICQHKAPVFGKPPRWFTYSELELATGGFSQANFLAEGGFGLVHRGVLSNGQVIAVKQHKLASSQGDVEFCSEVEVLSCAQHRNVVMLIGFCVEDGRRLLVYEYICNGSLYSHLYGQNRHPLEWPARRKIAVGAARGLRYLHEECRVGCIVHRDMRPHNILLTHDFEPLVGDFGLARWQPDGDMGVATRVIGTFGYLAPEYAQSGQITEKADVYSFGVVLVELVTGRKAMDINRPKGQQSLTEWARPLLKECVIDDLVDPRLTKCYSEQEVHNMLRCASLCIKRDPLLRPRMSQVLRMLEGDIVMNLAK